MPFNKKCCLNQVKSHTVTQASHNKTQLTRALPSMSGQPSSRVAIYIHNKEIRKLQKKFVNSDWNYTALWKTISYVSSANHLQFTADIQKQRHVTKYQSNLTSHNKTKTAMKSLYSRNINHSVDYSRKATYLIQPACLWPGSMTK